MTTGYSEGHYFRLKPLVSSNILIILGTMISQYFQEQYNHSNKFAWVNAMHLTSSVFINDDASGLCAVAWETGLQPYKHKGYEDNADAHLKRTIMGREVVYAIREG